MLRTEEIRWFFKKPNTSFETWFREKGSDINKQMPRTDHYLPLPDKPDLGIKIREGRMEIKIRTSRPTPGSLGPKAHGCFEEYTKWGVEIKEDDPLRNAIINEHEEHWTAVEKRRAGLILTLQNGKIRFHSMDTPIDRGCQLEYTAVNIGAENWHTLGLEWFGSPRFTIPGEIVQSLMEDTLLTIEDSKGYTEFLKENFWNLI